MAQLDSNIAVRAAAEWRDNQQNDRMISAADVQAMLGDRPGTTIANIGYVTDVQLAAKHRDAGHTVQKVTYANVMLAGDQTSADIYLNRVLRTMDGDEFVKSDTYFEHTDVYSIVRHISRGSLYLFAMYMPNSNSKTAFILDGEIATREEVAELLTPSAAKRLLDTESTVYNKRNDVTHAAIVRTISLQNLVSISTSGTTMKA